MSCSISGRNSCICAEVMVVVMPLEMAIFPERKARSRLYTPRFGVLRVSPTREILQISNFPVTYTANKVIVDKVERCLTSTRRKRMLPKKKMSS